MITSKFYNHAVKLGAKKLLWFLLLCCAAFTVILFANKDIVMRDKDLYYYTFSTIAQTFLGLVAFLGSVCVFKLQILETEALTVQERLREPLSHFFGISQVGDMTWVEMKDKGLSMEGKDSADMRQVIIKVCSNRMEQIDGSRRLLRSSVVDFGLLSFLNVGLALIGLPLTRIFAGEAVSSLVGTLGLIYLLLNIALSIFSLFTAFRIVRKTFGYDFEVVA